MDPIIVKPGLTGKNNTLYIVLFVIFITLSLVAVFLFIQIQTSSKPKELIFSPTTAPAVVKKTSAPTTIPINDNQLLDTSEFRTEYLPDMKMTETSFEFGKKYSFVNKDITYEVSIGTDWSRVDPARNFNDKKATMNGLTAYHYSDDKTYMGFDFVGKKNKKYITLKCTYDPTIPGLGGKCTQLTASFYLLGE